jgi:hypothetical protein
MWSLRANTDWADYGRSLNRGSESLVADRTVAHEDPPRLLCATIMQHLEWVWAKEDRQASRPPVRSQGPEASPSEPSSWAAHSHTYMPGTSRIVVSAGWGTGGRSVGGGTFRPQAGAAMSSGGRGRFVPEAWTVCREPCAEPGGGRWPGGWEWRGRERRGGIHSRRARGFGGRGRGGRGGWRPDPRGRVGPRADRAAGSRSEECCPERAGASGGQPAARPAGNSTPCFAEAERGSGCSLKRDRVPEALQARRDPSLRSG